MKKRGFGIVYEILNSKRTNEVVVKLGDEIKIGDKTYPINHKDYFLSDYYGCPAVFVSENLRCSVNPNEEDVMLPTAKTISALIRKAYLEGNPEIVKWLKIGAVCLGLLFIGILFLAFMIVKNQATLSQLITTPPVI